MKILIVEPHPDDAVLSCFGYMEKMKEKHDISIIFMSSVDGRNSKKFCDYMGIEHLEIVPDIPDITFKEYRIPIAEIKSHPRPYIYQVDKYLEIGEVQAGDCGQKIYETLDKVKPDVVLGPLGVYHPFHVITRLGLDAACESYGKADKLLYADKPYSNKQYGLFIVNDALDTDVGDAKVFELPEAAVKLKLKIFRKCYPTESIHWDEPGMYKNPEIIFSPVNKE